MWELRFLCFMGDVYKNCNSPEFCQKNNYIFMNFRKIIIPIPHYNYIYMNFQKIIIPIPHYCLTNTRRLVGISIKSLKWQFIVLNEWSSSKVISSFINTQNPLHQIIGFRAQSLLATSLNTNSWLTTTLFNSNNSFLISSTPPLLCFAKISAINPIHSLQCLGCEIVVWKSPQL